MASEGVKVGAQPSAVGMFGSHGVSVGCPVLLPGSFLAPRSGTRHDARVRPGVSKECGSLLPIWRDEVRPLSVDPAAYEPVLGGSSKRYCVRVYGASCCFRLRPYAEVWRRYRLFGIDRWVTLFFTPHIDVARV